MRTALFLALLLALAIAAPALASDCETTSSRPDLLAPTCAVQGAPCVYVDQDSCLGHTGLCSVWVYQETNGRPGLQRGDEVHDDTCGGQIESDTIIF